jgi:hypothetical protein
MAGFALTLWPHQSNDAAILTVVSAMATALIKQNKSFRAQHCFQFAESYLGGRVAQLF